jgi:hypothetical protein
MFIQVNFLHINKSNLLATDSIAANERPDFGKISSAEFFLAFISLFLRPHLVVIAQLVRASDCGSEGRRFEPG